MKRALGFAILLKLGHLPLAWALLMSAVHGHALDEWPFSLLPWWRHITLISMYWMSLGVLLIWWLTFVATNQRFRLLKSLAIWNLWLLPTFLLIPDLLYTAFPVPGMPFYVAGQQVLESSSVSQTLLDNLSKVQIGSSRAEVQALVGPPVESWREGESWDYLSSAGGGAVGGWYVRFEFDESDQVRRRGMLFHFD